MAVLVVDGGVDDLVVVVVDGGVVEVLDAVVEWIITVEGGLDGVVEM